MAPQSSGNQGQQASILSQAAYTATDYQDASWEIVGDRIDSDNFSPMEVPVLPSQAQFIDPMFANYGGAPVRDANVRWHLPEALSQRQAAQAASPDQESEPTVTLTESERDAALQAAYEQGRQAGAAEAHGGEAEKLKVIEKQLSAVLIDFQKQLKHNLAAIEKKAVALALEISGRIIDTAVEINPEYIVQILNKAIKLSGTAVIKSVHVSPPDYEFIQLVGVAKSLKEFDGSWEFVEDGTIKAGCVVETSAGQIDYQLDAAWERIKTRVVRLIK